MHSVLWVLLLVLCFSLSPIFSNASLGGGHNQTETLPVSHSPSTSNARVVHSVIHRDIPGFSTRPHDHLHWKSSGVFTESSAGFPQFIHRVILYPSLRGAKRRSNPALLKALDCFAEPGIGRRFAPTRWLAMTMWRYCPGQKIPICHHFLTARA
jgi:hypothetical protein